MIIKQWAEELADSVGDTVLYPVSVRCEEVMWREKRLFCNADFFHASAYHFMGIPTKLLPRYLLCPDSLAGQRMSKNSEPTIGSYDPARIISGRSHLSGSTSATAERQRIPLFRLLLDYKLIRNSLTGIPTGRVSALDLGRL